jgi:hypothetical protein
MSYDIRGRFNNILLFEKQIYKRKKDLTRYLITALYLTPHMSLFTSTISCVGIHVQLQPILLTLAGEA